MCVWGGGFVYFLHVYIYVMCEGIYPQTYVSLKKRGSSLLYTCTGIYRSAAGMGGHLLYTCKGMHRLAAGMGGGGGITPYIHVQVYTEVSLEWGGGGVTSYIHVQVYTEVPLEWGGGDHLLYTCTGVYRSAAGMGGGSPPIYMYRCIQKCRWNGGGITSYIHVQVYTEVPLEWGGHLLYTCTGVYRSAAGMGGSPPIYMYRCIQKCRWNGGVTYFI